MKRVGRLYTKEYKPPFRLQLVAEIMHNAGFLIREIQALPEGTYIWVASAPGMDVDLDVLNLADDPVAYMIKEHHEFLRKLLTYE